MEQSIYRSSLLSIIAAAIFLLSMMSSASAQASSTGIGTFAIVPADPGFPKGVAVDGTHVYVSGPARFGTAGTGPSAIQVYTRKTGTFESTIYVTGEMLAFEHAVSNIAVDSVGRIDALSTQLGLIRFTK